jgi:amino acid adenylation domain-containing protein
MGQVENPASRGADGARRAQLESAIAEIWCEVIGVPAVAADEDFFELGGDSLAAVRMLAAVEDLLLAQVSFTDFLDAPTVAALAGVVSNAGERSEYGLTRPAPPEPSGQSPVSHAQERLWFLHELEGATNAYNMPIGARLRGPIDPGALERSLREIVRRHAALRTTFRSRDGDAVAVQAAAGVVDLGQLDLRGYDHPEAEAALRIDALVGAPLDLERGPLMRALLVRIAEREHILELVFHHIICDGWSHVIVLRELGALYGAYSTGEAPHLPEPRIQYPDYARRQRRNLSGSALEDAVTPWLTRLAGAPAALELPTDRPRPQNPSYRGSTYRRSLSPQTAAAVRSFARTVKATPFTSMLAVYYVLLHRYTGQEDIIVGATTSGRNAPDLEDGIGLFASTVALRCDVSGQPTFRELVARARDVVMWAVAHEDAPFEQIVARLGHKRDLSRHPVFQVFCAHVPQAPLELDGAQPYDARPTTSRFDLTLFVEEERGDALELAWEYSTDLFDATTIERLHRQYVRMLEAALADPDLPIDELPLIDEAQRGQAEWMQEGRPARAAYPVACMHELFERHAAADPDAVAVTFDRQALTYDELNRRANRLAHHLLALGAGPETLVALFLEPSLEVVTAILGVLKSGAAYVPLDPEHPSERVGFVLADTAAPLLITQTALLDRLPAHQASTICLDRDADSFASDSDVNPGGGATPGNLAYVIYTSGSTGQPKGVQVEHRHVARLFSATDAWYGFGPQDTWVLLHSYAFDFSVWELWGALAYGGRLVISPLWTTRSPQALADLVAGERVTVMNATPSLFVVAQDELLRVADRLALRYVVFGGEALAPATLAPWFEHFGDTAPTLVNMYGITETTVHVTYRPLRAADCELGGSPIGIPIPDLSLHLLDRNRAAVPPGVAGELFVGGAGVARGYLNRPQLTAERFIENPFGEGRLYRTGDLARRLPDGGLEFRGRIDDQVKIRGFRIELGEIQAAIRELPGVADCAVAAVQAAPGDTRLAAYVVPGDAWKGAAAEHLRDELLAHLQRKLPAYMVPASIMSIDRLPLTRNGKTDRRALPPPTWETRADQGFLSPATPTEELIAEVWRGVLGVQQVGAHDNFFNLGGHSLLAARVATQVRKRCEMDLSVRALFEHPTLTAFAAHVDSLRRSASAPAEAAGGDPAAIGGDPAALPHAVGAGGEPQDASPISFQQQELLFFDALEPGSVTYNAALAIRVTGELDVALLRNALEAVFERHEALRTVFAWEDGSARQVVLEDWRVELAVLDISGPAGADRDAKLGRLLLEHGRRPFDLSADLMLRATLFALAPADHVLLFVAHHVAFDAWAVEILYRELSELYDAARGGRAPQLPKLAQQYRDFARWQRERLSGERLDRQLDFWRAQLAGAPTVLRLPTDRPRPAQQTFAGASHTIALGAGLAPRVRELCQSEQVTPYVLLLGAFATLLYRRSGQDDILVGGPMANRDQPGLEQLIGFFANTIVVRARLAGNPRFAELLAGVRESVLASYEHQEVPLELVVGAVAPERQPGVNPLFQVNFRVRVGAPPVLHLSGTETSLMPVDLGLARFDLALELHLLDDAIAAEFNYNTALFEPGTIRRLAADFERMLSHALADPRTRLLSLELAERPPTVGDGHGAAPAAAGIRRYRDSAPTRPRD